jgi:murein L,D-transpeptidase YcbB/YkuD
MGAAMTANAAAASATPAAPAAPAAGKTEWPTDKNAIIAFQKANGLTPDGMIGGKTMQALQKAGATPPAGFKPVGNKAAAPAANTAAAPAAAAGAGAGRGGQGGATAAELAAYNATKTPPTMASATGVGQAGPTKAAAAGADASNPLNVAKTAPTTSNQKVSGTIKMGKPEGPITFNGKVVQPGAPEYAAASQALLAQQQKMQQFGQRPQKPSTAPVAMGAANADKRDYEESLNRMLSIAGLR